MPLDLVAIRRDLHRYPEVAFNEYRTATVIESVLQSLGLSPRRMAETGVICDIPGTENAPLIAIRADTDALPIQEQTNLEFASSVPSVMHACGHDAHVAILLGAAERLLSSGLALRRGIRLVFQPAEETTEGAKALISAGVMQGVSAIFGLHNLPSLPVGTAAFRTGELMASSDRFRITVTGKGGHAASPHLAVDPLVAGAAVLTGLQTIVSRTVNPLDPAVVTIGQFQGGTTFNVIPERAEMEGTVRCFSGALRKSMPGILQTAATGIAAGYRCTATVEYRKMVPAVSNDDELTTLAKRVARRILSEASVLDAQPTMGAEDFALYQEIAPGCIFWLGSGGPYNWHHPCFNIDERVLATGANLLSQIAGEAALVH